MYVRILKRPHVSGHTLYHARYLLNAPGDPLHLTPWCGGAKLSRKEAIADAIKNRLGPER